jgi:hypothetical protein
MDPIVERLCALPRNFRAGKLSTISLVRASGYLSAPQVLTREAVLAVLRHDPLLIEDWEIWSGDQRTDRGWFLEPQGAGYRLPFDERRVRRARAVLRSLRGLRGVHRPAYPGGRGDRGLEQDEVSLNQADL